MSNKFKCQDCDFTSRSQGNLGVHRVKKHPKSFNGNIDHVSVVCEYPKGKPFYCCLCENVIKSYPNFKRHFHGVHEGVALKASAICTICNRNFKDLKGAGVHAKIEHGITKTKIIAPTSPSPIMTVVNLKECNPLANSPEDTDTQTPTPSSKKTRKRRENRLRKAQKSALTSPDLLGKTTDNTHVNTTTQITPKTTSRVSFTTPINSETASPDSPENDRSTIELSTTPLTQPSFTLDEEDDSFENNISMPPQQTKTNLELVVALIDCTAKDRRPKPTSQPIASNPPPILEDIDDDEDDEPQSITRPLNPMAPAFNNQSVVNTELDFNSSASVYSQTSSCGSDQGPHSPLDDSNLLAHSNSSHNGQTSNEIPVSPDPDQENISQFVASWSSKVISATDFDNFSNVCEELAEAIVVKGKEMSNTVNGRKRSPRPAANRPNRKHPRTNRPRVLNNPIEARRLQTLYRISKKRAARQILKDNNTIYTGTKENAEKYFSETFDTKYVDIDELTNSLRNNVPSANPDPTLLEPMSAKQIKRKLMAMSNSAPGKDKVEYRHLKLADPNCKILEHVFNRCISEKKIPAIWKHSSIILIYKKGNSEDVANFRPIALMSCIYKLFTSLLASRLSSFAIDQKLLSDTQKSARPSEGCHEHTFTLQAVIADCKRNNKNCFMAWLDLRNAFGSISHEAIYTTLQYMGIPEDMIALIKDIYTDASTTIKTSANVETIPINIKAGVKQGCPLSPILFNLTTELLIRQVTLKCDEDKKIPFHIHGQPIFILAFADDLVLVSSSRSGLQDILDEVSSAASILNLEFRPDKCASLALTCRKHEQSRVDNATTFKVQNNIMPALSKEQSYRYLGVPISLIYDAKEMNTITETLISDLDKLRDSQLAPWQKLDAIRTFIQPCLTYALRSCPVTKDSLHAYRKKLVDVLRSICHLPKRSSVHYFFADRACGGLGLQDPFDERNV